MKEKGKSLQSNYHLIRKTKEDADSYFLAVMYAYLEYLIVLKGQELVNFKKM